MDKNARAMPRDLRQAVRDLGSAQTSPAGVPAYTRHVNRPLGRLAAALAFVLGLTPNQVTIISGLVSLLSTVALVTVEPSWVLGVSVALGLVLGYVLDSADGQLARLRGGGSQAGEWLDHVVDAVRLPALHLAVLIALFRFHDDISVAFLLIPIMYQLVAIVRFFAMMLAEQMKRYAAHTRGEVDPSGDSILRSLIILPLDFGVLCLIFVAWGSSNLFLALYGLLFVANALLLPVTLGRRYRELAGTAHR